MCLCTFANLDCKFGAKDSAHRGPVTLALRLGRVLPCAEGDDRLCKQHLVHNKSRNTHGWLTARPRWGPG